MKLPIRTFWLMSDNIDRISAQGDVRALTVAVCGQGGEPATRLRESLVVEIGQVVKLREDPTNAARDEEGFHELKMMAQGF